MAKMTDHNQEITEGSNELVLFIWKKRKILAISTVIVAVITAGISFLLTPEYLSTAIIFPTATSTVSFSEQRNAKASSMDFGEEEQAEQMVQILSSSRIRDLVVQRFDLMKHYEIDANDENKYYKLNQEYNGHITFTRTRYGSIQIDVLDRDRELAAEIANKIVDLIDTVKNQMVKERTVPAFEINKRKKQLIEATLWQVNNKLDSLSRIGVVTSEARANLFQAYNQAGGSDRAFFKNQLDVNIKHGAEFDALCMLRDEKTVKLAEFEDSYEQSESDAYTDFTHKFVVERAVVADKKEKPKRMIIVIITSLFWILLMIFGLLIQERVRQLSKLA